MSNGFKLLFCKKKNILLSTVLFSAYYPYKLSKLPPIVNTGSLLALYSCL